MEPAAGVGHTSAVAQQPSPRASTGNQSGVNPRKVRAGLAIICLAVVIAAVGLFVIPSTAGRAVMLAVAVTAVVRAALLVRSLRRDA